MNTNNLAVVALKMYYLIQSTNDFAENVDKNIQNVDYKTKPELVHLLAFTLRCEERPYIKHLLECVTELRSVVCELLKTIIDNNRFYGIPIGVEEVIVFCYVFI